MIIKSKSEKAVDILEWVSLLALCFLPITLIVSMVLMAYKIIETTPVSWLITLIPGFISLFAIMTAMILELKETIKSKR